MQQFRPRMLGPGLWKIICGLFPIFSLLLSTKLSLPILYKDNNGDISLKTAPLSLAWTFNNRHSLWQIQLKPKCRKSWEICPQRKAARGCFHHPELASIRKLKWPTKATFVTTTSQLLLYKQKQLTLTINDLMALEMGAKQILKDLSIILSIAYEARPSLHLISQGTF